MKTEQKINQVKPIKKARALYFLDLLHAANKGLQKNETGGSWENKNGIFEFIAA